jgi:hypothetical protein
MYKRYFLSSVLLLSLMLCSCTKERVDKVPTVSIDISSARELESSILFSKIELIPLETTDSSLVSTIRQMIFTDEFIIMSDNKNIISVFDKKGNFISNSKKRYGQGPEDYGILMGMSLNNHINNVEVLTPNYLMSYDIHFNFKAKSKLPVNIKTSPQKGGQYFGGLFALVKDKYMLLPTTVSNDPYRIVVFDAKKNKIVKEISYADQVVAALTQQVQNINYYNDSILSFSPNAFSYFYYTLDLKTLNLKKQFKLDFGIEHVMPKDLMQFKTEREKCDYLAFDSKFPLPLRTFFNDKYIITLIRKESEYFTYIKQIKTSMDFLIKNKLEKGQRQMPFFEGLIDNILYAKINPDELEKFVDPDLLDKQGRMIFENKDMEDNPVIVKYYLK